MIATELQDIATKIIQIARSVDGEKEELKKLAKEKAETEKNYRVALMQNIFELKTMGYAVGLINDLARGKTADLKFQRDLSESLFAAQRQSIDASLGTLTAFQSLLKIMKEFGE